MNRQYSAFGSMVCIGLIAVAGCGPARYEEGAEAAGAVPDFYDLESSGIPFRFTGRSLLKGGEEEPLGYGLYSYILMSRRPESDSREEDLLVNVFVEYIRAIRIVEEIQAEVHDPALINVTFVPVETWDFEDAADSERTTQEQNQAMAEAPSVHGYPGHPTSKAGG